MTKKKHQYLNKARKITVVDISINFVMITNNNKTITNNFEIQNIYNYYITKLDNCKTFIIKINK